MFSWGYSERDWSAPGTAEENPSSGRPGLDTSWGRCRNQDQRFGCARSPQSPQLPQAKRVWDQSDWVPPSLQVACSPRRWPVLFQSPSLWPVLPVEARPCGLLGSLGAAVLVLLLNYSPKKRRGLDSVSRTDYAPLGGWLCASSLCLTWC